MIDDVHGTEHIADGGHEERLPWCAECNAFAVPDEDGTCGECGGNVVLTDGGTSRVCSRCGDSVDSEHVLRCNGRVWGVFCTDCHDTLAEIAVDEQGDQQRRQADALEDVAERLQVQNGILFELITELDRRNSIAMKGVPDDAQRPTSRATGVQDGVTYLAENVDLEEATRWADE